MTTLARAAPLLLATAAALVAGCGSSGEDAASAPAATTSATAPAPTATPTATTASAPAKVGSSTPTPMGSILAFGGPAVVVYDDTIHHHSSAVRVTPHAIEAGTLDDFKNIKLDADQKTSSPFYVKVDVENIGEEDLSGGSPGAYLNGVDDRGQDQNEVIFFGDFPECEPKIPKSFKPGARYSTCLTYLIPKGGSLKGMRWIAFDEKTGKSNIDWK
jgi:hypothetical protein